MRPLEWEEYYQHFNEWSERTREQYISRLCSFGDHSDVAAIVNHIYTQGAATKLLIMALDAGVVFDADELFLMDGSVSDEALERARQSMKPDNQWVKRRAQKKANRKAFWDGAAEVMFIDDTIDSLFGKK